MGIRKGWVLCGVRVERCLISHAVSSHPLLELQTLHSLLTSPTGPAFWISFKKKKNFSFSSLHHKSFGIFFFFLILWRHSPPSASLLTRQELFRGNLEFFSLQHQKKKNSGQRRDLFFFFFLSSTLPPDCLSVEVIPDFVHANEMGGSGGGGGGAAYVWIHPLTQPHSPFPPAPLSCFFLFVFFFFSLGGADVGRWAEARWEILGMGSH